MMKGHLEKKWEYEHDTSEIPYMNGFHNTFYAVTSGINGDIYVAGKEWDSTGIDKQLATIMCISGSGSKRWEVIEGSSQKYNTGEAIAVNELGDIFVAGRSWSNNFAKAWIMKIHPNGKIVYKKNIPTPKNLGVDPNIILINIDQTTLAFITNLRVTNQGGITKTLVKLLTPSGKTLKQHILERDTISNVISAHTFDNSIYLLGENPTSLNPRLLKLTPEGSILWAKDISKRQTTRFRRIESPQDNLLLIGNTTLKDKRVAAYIQARDKDGKLLWKQDLDSIGVHEGNLACASKFQDRIILGGTAKEHKNSPNSALICSLDKSGKAVQHRLYSSNQNSSFISIANVTGGGIVAAGAKNHCVNYNGSLCSPNEISSAYVIRMD